MRFKNPLMILKPVNSTFDNYVYPLPNMLYMTQTDATNIIGPQLLDTTGDVVQYRSAQIDYLYGVNTAYTFSITGYINAMLNTAGTAENGLFILQEPPTASKQIHRGVFGSRQYPKFQTKLVLTLMTVD